METELTAELLRVVLNYDAEAGQLKWRVDCGSAKAGQVAGSVGSKGYVQVGLGRRGYAAHRLVWLHVYGAWPTHVIDHVNGNKTDNRITNLRDIPQRVNLQNQRHASGKNKTSPYIGAWKDKQYNRWISRITVDKRVIHLGRFATAEDAHNAYVSAKRRLHEGCTL